MGRNLLTSLSGAHPWGRRQKSVEGGLQTAMALAQTLGTSLPDTMSSLGAARWWADAQGQLAEGDKLLQYCSTAVRSDYMLGQGTDTLMAGGQQTTVALSAPRQDERMGDTVRSAATTHVPLL
jgi:hypothetical protein